MTYISRKTQAIIDLQALKSNYQQIKALAPNSKTIAVIKANAYGHGSVEVAKALRDEVPAFAVAFIDEAMVLRDAGITQAILILEGAMQPADYIIAEQQNLHLMIHAQNQLSWLLDYAINKEIPLLYQGSIWLKVDTGMNRLGFAVNELDDVLRKLQTVITTEYNDKFVLCTHCSIAESKTEAKTSQQIQTLVTLARKYQCQYSISNSSGILNWPQGHGHWNRLGLALYGVSPLNRAELSDSAIDNILTPVMTLIANIIALRAIAIGDTVGYGDSWRAKRASVIATIAIGYADGYPRHAKFGTPVWLHNQSVPIVGRVSMDMITIDITDIVDSGIEVKLGDTVELFGHNITVETVAEYCETINYEILTRISERVHRVYTNTTANKNNKNT